MEVIPAQSELATVKAERDELRAAFARQVAMNEKLQRQLEQLIKARFGKTSEKLNPEELLPFAQAALAAMQANGEAKVEEVPAAKEEQPAAPKSGRRKLPKNLRRVTLVHKPSAEDCTCPACNIARVKIGENRSEVLEYQPAELFVTEHVEEVHACPNRKKGTCEEPIVAGFKPPAPIEKGQAAPSLLAQVVVSKYADHLPLYRLEQMLSRAHLDIPRSTMCEWAMQVGEFLEPLRQRMKRKILEGQVIQSDDTPVSQQEPGGRGTFEARFWLYRGDDAHPYTLFDYRTDRSRNGPLEWFANSDYHGHLQRDAYAGYDEIIRQSGGKIVSAGCLAHARRKFKEASEGTGGDARACVALAIMQRMYALEKEAKEEADGDRNKLHAARETKRTTQGKALWNELAAWTAQVKSEVLPRSPLGTALTYLENQWQDLIEPWQKNNGHLDVDNNAGERDLRGIAIGRKNWLFTGSERGGKNAAILFSLLVSAKRQDANMNLVAYLTDLLTELPKLRDEVCNGKKGWGDYTADARLDEYLPDAWAKKNPPQGAADVKAG